MKTSLLAGVLILCQATVTLAADTDPTDAAPEENAATDINKVQERSQNPFSDIRAVVLEHLHIEDQNGFGNKDSEISAIRAFSSFKIDDGDYIARIITPYAHDLPNGADGIGDSTIALGRTYAQRWGVFGVGLQSVLPTGTDDFTNDGYRFGPILGGIRIDGPVQYGLVNFNEFTTIKDSDADDVNLSRFQFFGSYHLGKGLTVGLSEMMAVYDWEEDEFTNLPLGAGISQIIPFNGLYAKIEFSYEHNFYDELGGEGNTYRLRLTFLEKG